MSRTVSPIHGETVAEALAALDREDRGLTFVGDDTYVSFAELNRVTAELVDRWLALGTRPGDRVLLVVTDEREFALSLLSAMRAGLVAVPVFPPTAFGNLDVYTESLRRVAKAADATVCLAGDRALAPVTAAGLPCRILTPDELFHTDPAGIAKAPAPGPRDPALVQFTSGSTGDPRGVQISQHALVSHARSLIQALEIDGAVDRGVTWLPLYHDMGLIGKIVSAVLSQTPVWIVSPQRFAKDPMDFLRLVSDVRGTISFAPTFAYGLLARRAESELPSGLDLSAWRVAGCGAEPVQADTLRRFAAAFVGAAFPATALVPCYGLAEATLAVSATKPGSGLTTLRVDPELLTKGVAAVCDRPEARELVSCGRPLPGARVHIVDDAGRKLPDDTVGEIVVEADYLADGYRGDPTATALTWRADGLHTGDTGFRSGGELYVTGRIKDLIIVNGRNHQPHDIERAAEGVDGVRPSSAVAVPTPAGHTEAARLVVEATGYPPAAGFATRITQAVQHRTGVPVAEVVVVRRGKVPKTSSGKPRRRHTAALLDAGELVAWDFPPRRKAISREPDS